MARLREVGADVGICLDGDADRVILIDETGMVADGDQIMALFAARWAEEGRLKGSALATTVMSNLGLERYLAARDVGLHRTAVGDRYVVEAMRAHGWNLGGEQSGHIVMTDYATTGDGLIAGLQFLAEMVRTGQPASQLARNFETVPQLLRNVRYGAGQTPLERPAVQAAIAAGEAKLLGHGRLLIRKSGTEPAFQGEFTDNKAKGTYSCRECGSELFTSDTKFDSQCGWPSFYTPLAQDRVLYLEYLSGGRIRTEVRCANCGGHLGHVFEGEGFDTPTDLRFCINSISINFAEEN